MKKLYQYQFPLKSGAIREGLILQIGDNFGEIAPLPHLSRETFAEAKAEALRLLPIDDPAPTLPSVQFGFACAQTPLPTQIRLPINSFNQYRPNFPALKLKIGHLSLEEALTLVRRIPKSTSLRLDFNRQWPLEKLLRFADHFQPADFDYLEEPTDNLSDLIAFSTKTAFPIALDESRHPPQHIPTLKALVVKPTISAIPTPPQGIELIFTFAYETGIGILHIARLAQLHNPHRPHGLDLQSYLTHDLIDPSPASTDGLLHWKGPIHLTERACLIATVP